MRGRAASFGEVDAYDVANRELSRHAFSFGVALNGFVEFPLANPAPVSDVLGSIGALQTRGTNRRLGNVRVARSNIEGDSDRIRRLRICRAIRSSLSSSPPRAGGALAGDEDAEK